jgi:crotonobetainyl-CoA:carnitine CoA-transferase CaiB-like acyl-CoA transferase
VLELATLLNGATVGATLGDLGADVVKLEHPVRGDYVRYTAGLVSPHNSPSYVQVNRHKRSVALNLKLDEDREIFWRLLETADVFVDGFTAGACDRLGIGYEQQRACKPSIVHCQYSGYGGDGPYATMPTHGWMQLALASGTPKAVGDDGFLHATPMREVPTILMRDARMGGEATAAGAAHAALHIAAALYRRGVTGEGCHIDVAGVDGVLANAWISSVYSLNESRIVDRTDMPPEDVAESGWAKYQYYETKDGKVVLFGAIEPKFWKHFCDAIERPDLVGVEKPAGSLDYNTDQNLRQALKEIFLTRPQQEWVHLALKHDFPCGPALRTIVEAAADAQVRSRQIFHDGKEPGGNDFTYVGEAGKMAGLPYRVQRPAPALGEHTREVLSEIGVEEATIARLEGAVVR